MRDFMDFRRMVTPFIIQLLFALGTLAALAGGAYGIGKGIHNHDRRELLVGVGVLLLGPLVVRVYAEVLIVVFRINETLTDIWAIAERNSTPELE